jgi:hypothetical protein
MTGNHHSITAGRFGVAIAVCGCGLIRFLGACDTPLVGNTGGSTGTGGATTATTTSTGGSLNENGAVSICVQQLDGGAGEAGVGGGSADSGCATDFIGVADGRSIVPILVTTSLSSADQADGGPVPITIHLYASDGTWLAPEGTTLSSDSSLDVQMIDGTKFSAAFVAGAKPTPVWVYASRGDDVQSILVPMSATPIAGIEVIAKPAFLSAATTNQILLTATVLGVNGATPSDGTRVSFDVAPPIFDGAQVYPSTAPIDATGTATATLVVVAKALGDAGASDPDAPDGGSFPTYISVSVTAIPPEAAAGPPPTTISIPVGP